MRISFTMYTVSFYADDFQDAPVFAFKWQAKRYVLTRWKGKAVYINEHVYDAPLNPTSLLRWSIMKYETFLSGIAHIKDPHESQEQA